MEETIAYLKERTSFGKAIIKNQGVAFPLADYWTRMESARNYCYRALWLRDQGLPHTREAAQAKMLGSQLASEAIHACILFHCHYGYTQEFPVEQRLRDVIGLEIGDGTPQASLMVIATDLFGREFRPY